jgi:uncharacterized protein YgbK (DUF1537 family)
MDNAQLNHQIIALKARLFDAEEANRNYAELIQELCQATNSNTREELIAAVTDKLDPQDVERQTE